MLTTDNGAIDSVAAKELYGELDRLFDITVEYRNALRAGDQASIYSSNRDLVAGVQALYYFSEKHSACDVRLAGMAIEIVSRFNKYVPLFNAFANATDRNSTDAQKTAELADTVFTAFVEAIVKSIAEVKIIVESVQDKDSEKEKAYPTSAFNPQIKVNLVNEIKIDNNVNIVISMEQAKRELENGDIDEKEKIEALGFIEELKTISENHKDKKSRWAKIKDKLKWIADKSVCVASAVIPLITSLLNG